MSSKKRQNSKENILILSSTKSQIIEEIFLFLPFFLRFFDYTTKIAHIKINQFLGVCVIYFFYCLAGFLSGIFGGLGMGGGTILIPVLTIFLGFDQKLSQGINLLSFLVMAIFSVYIHYRNGYIVTKNIFWIVTFGVIFSVFGAILMSFLPSKILKIIFGVFLCVLAVVEFVKVLKK